MKSKINFSLIFICLLSIIGALIYKIYALNFWGTSVSLASTILIFIIILRKNKKNNSSSKKRTISTLRFDDWIFPSAYLIMVLTCFVILFLARTDTAITSPWKTVPISFFIFYFLATIILFLSIALKTKFNIFLISLHYFLSFSVALVVYKLGFGFDSFIHEATCKLIAQTGAVEPKPFYYLGFYSLIIIFHKITWLPIGFLNKILVPLLASITLPFFLKDLLKHWLQNERNIEFTVLFALALPFSIFIASTPQNLAYLLILLIILISLKRDKNNSLLLYLLALTAFFTQPIAGIPAILFVSAITFYHYLTNIKLKKILLVICFLALVFSLPFAFYLVERSQAQNAVTEIKNVTTPGPTPLIPWPQNPGQDNFFLNFVYLIIFNFKIIYILLTGIGIYLTRRYKFLILFYLTTALSLLSAYFFTSALPFHYLIAYERNNYTDRILILIAMFLLPFVLITLYTGVEKIQKQDKFIKISFSLFLVALVVTSLYASYPRLDNYYNAHGIATNQNDVTAVQWIESNAENEDYIVLANQQVSAASLHEFGFKKYYHISSPYQGEDQGEVDIFYYPIPTGGPLYQYFLKMVYDQPTRATMLDAMNLAGVKTGYFVLNKYWWAFPKLLEEAKMEADFWQEINNGEIFIFKYQIK